MHSKKYDDGDEGEGERDGRDNVHVLADVGDTEQATGSA